MLRRLFVAAVTLVALAYPAAAASAATAHPTPAPCHVTAHQADGPGVQVTGTCDQTISVATWLAPTLSGNPIYVQTLVPGSVSVINGVHGSAYLPVLLPSGPQSSCFVQVDVAFGAPSIPYGPRLIAAWHAGSTNCLVKVTSPPPSTTPPVTTSPPETTPPPASSTPPPATTPPATTTPPVVTTPPAITTTPPTVTTPPAPSTPPVTTAPPTTTPPKPTPSRTHPPTLIPPTSLSRTPTPAPTTSPPAKPPVLPFTGFDWQPVAGAGALAMAAGAGLVWASRRRKA